MVIDDERAILTVVKRILSSEHDVFAFDNAAAALEVLSGGARFDVILCDLMMPNMSGMDLHGELGRVASSEQRRMVFMTGGTFTVRTRAFVESVGNRILEKPIGGLVLREIVRAHAR